MQARPVGGRGSVLVRALGSAFGGPESVHLANTKAKRCNALKRYLLMISYYRHLKALYLYVHLIAKLETRIFLIIQVGITFNYPNVNRFNGILTQRKGR